MTTKERYKLWAMRSLILIFCCVIPCLIIFRLTSRPSTDLAVLTPTDIPKETMELWAKYAEVFPKDSLARVEAGNNERLFEAIQELSLEEWEEAKVKLKEQEWQQTAATSLLLQREYVGVLVTQEESKRPIDLWVRVRYTDYPENRKVDEHVWAIRGKDDNSIVILYLSRKER